MYGVSQWDGPWTLISAKPRALTCLHREHIERPDDPFACDWAAEWVGGWDFGRLGSGPRTPVKKAHMTIVRCRLQWTLRIIVSLQGEEELVHLRWFKFDLRGDNTRPHGFQSCTSLKNNLPTPQLASFPSSKVK